MVGAQTGGVPPVKFETFVANRYLRAKRKQAFIGVISVITLIGITLGVAALNISLSVHNGMREAFIKTLIGDSGRLTLTRGNWGAPGFDPKEREQILQIMAEMPSVRAVSLQRRELCMLLTPHRRSAYANVVAVMPEHELAVSSYIEPEEAGSFRALDERPADARPGVVLGADLAAKLGVSRGDVLRMVFPALSSPSLVIRDLRFKQRVFEVLGTFRSGSSELDEYLAFIRLEVMLELLNSNEISQVEVKLVDTQVLDSTKAAIRQHPELPEMTRVVDLRDINSELLAALKLEKWGTTLIIGLIILIAALNMVSALIMMVMEKHRDIGILKSMGATRRMLMGIFVRQGMSLSIWGTCLGTVLGVGIALWADYTQILSLPQDVYEVLSYLPFRIKLHEVIVVALGSLLISFVSTLYPSFQAASLDPVEALRYE